MAITLDGTTGITTPGLSLAIENFSTTGNTTLGDASTDTLNVGNGGLVKDASGNVGIGTSSPSRKLQVQTTGANSEIIVTTVTSGNPRLGMDASGAYYNWIQTDRSSGAIQFAISNSESMRLSASGNLGIGTTSPSSRLYVESSSGAQAIFRNTDGGSYTSLRLYNDTNLALRALEIDYYGSTNNERAEIFCTGAYPLLFGTNNTERARIDSSGNWGLGVTPNANWSTAFKAFDIGFTGNSLVGFGASDVGILSGCYYQGGGSAGWKWSTTNSLGASYYEQYNGASIWYISAPTAHTAGNPVTFTQAMTLAASGNFAVGTTETGVAKVNIGLAGTAITGSTTGTTMGASAIFQLNNSNASTTNSTVMLLGGGTASTVGQISSGFGFTRENAESTWGTQIRFYTHPSDTSVLSTLNEVMRINSSGHVTKPYHPAFAALGLGNAQVNSYANDLPGPLLFSSVGINTGSFYNSSTGRFTAPVAGAYYFSWSLLIDNNAGTGTVSYAQLYKNGASTSFTCYSQSPVGGYYTPMSQSCVLSLNANDYVYVHGGGGNIHTGSESAFTGFLIG